MRGLLIASNWLSSNEVLPCEGTGMTDAPAKQKILVVDDAPGNIRMLIEMFASDYEMGVATNGEEALQATLLFKPDLILLDIEMPKLDGYEVCVRLKADPETRSIPIIFLTARDNELDEAKGLQLGACDYITKPFCPDVATARVGNHLALKRHRDDMERMMIALQEARESAEQASQAKGEFLSNMSHEIRTPMNAIMGLADLALGVEMSPKLRDYLGKIARSSQSLLRIINDILDFSKIEAGKLELERSDFLLGEVFDHLADLFRGKVTEKHLELVLCLTEECWYELCGDSLRLEQVLMNLIGNALKFTEEGEIEVRAKTLQASAHRVILEFSVRDTGIGMAAAYRDQLFLPFTQADTSVTRRFGGTGLGLSISKRLVELMGGTLWVDSEPGRGSLFRFTAPFQRKLGAKIENLRTPKDMVHLKALVVDDNNAARKALQKMLGACDFSAAAVGSGEEAIQAIQQGIAENNPYQLILMDWLMPDMDGIQTLRKLKETLSPESFPKALLLIPDDREERLRSVGNAVGVNAYLPKPVNCTLLFDRIMQIFDRDVARRFRRGRGKDAIDPQKVMERVGGARVLLVEDNAINQQVAREILEAVGLTVALANNGLEAVVKVAESAYDILLMDIQMPEMDGYQASRRIRSDPKFGKLPIVAMTAHAMTGDREKCLEAGMNDHISKPINRMHLYGVLMEWIAPREGLGLTLSLVPSVPSRREGVAKEDTVIPDALPGIDMESAMVRFNGNRHLYRTLLIEFDRNYAGSYQQIQSHLTGRRKDDLMSAARLVHTIKGVAGNISARRLYDAALALEQGMKDSRETAMMALDVYEKTLHEVVAGIQAMKQREEALAPGEETSASEGIALDMEKIRPLMQALSEQIRRKAFKARESFSDLKPHLTHAPMGVRDELKQLEALIDSFDFKNAHHSLGIIAEILKVDWEAGRV
ncbi:two-component system, sensor histidine kinase and response regulator [Gammaproteobacteria bacterium]